MSRPRPDWLLLERFLAGECSPVEAAEVRRWLDTDSEAAASLDALRRAIGRQTPSEPAPPVWDVERAWARLDNETRGDLGGSYRLPPALRRVDPIESSGEELAPMIPPTRIPFDLGRTLRPASWRWWRIAAVFVLLAGGGLWVSHWDGGASPRLASSGIRIITAQRAERADVRLPDGTHVVLAPESRLTIPAEFGRISREVTLVGEGYFEVVHDARKPFLVHAAYGVVHDLGTRFVVRAYPGDSAVQVVVAEGRVVAELAGAPRPLRGPVLGHGDLARLARDGALILAHGVDVDRYRSWTEDRLRFDATPLRDVLPEVARWYDLDVELVDPAAGDRRVTLTLRNEPLGQVLSAIATLTNTRYDQVGRRVRFSTLPATSPAPRAP